MDIINSSINEYMTYEDTLDDPLEAYDLIIYEEEELCYYKNKEILLTPIVFQYFLLLAKNKGNFVSYDMAENEMIMKESHVDKTKERINKAFKQQLNNKNIKIIENKANRGNRITVNPNLIKILKRKMAFS